MKIRNLLVKWAARAVLIGLLLGVAGMTKMYAYDFSAVCETGQTLYYNILDASNHHVELTFPGTDDYNCWSGFTLPTGNIILPESVQNDGVTYTVTCIGSKAFYGCSDLTGSLTIPNTVTSIGESAFEGCTGFSGDLVIPNSVTAIGKYAFSDCSSFTGNLTISNSLTTIDDGTFSSCYGFSGDLNIPNSVTTIGYGAFYECYGFTDGILTIPNSVTTIEGYAFAGGIDFAEVHYNTATCEGSYYYSAPPFLGCGGRLIIGDNVETMPAYMFYVSYFTEAITLGTNPPTIEDYVFEATDFPIYVPYESLDDYKANWSEYESRIYPWLQKSIIGYGTSTVSDKWIFIASPITENTAPTTIDGMIAEIANEYDLYRFNQNPTYGKEWENYKAKDGNDQPLHPDFTTLVNGQGYLYANKEDVNLIFKGDFNEGTSMDVELAYTEGMRLVGWNLVGNPFPYSTTVTGRSYYVMNEAGTGINPEAVSAGGTIDACTGIVVKAESTETNPTVTFSKVSRQTTSNNGLLQIAVANTSMRSNLIEDKAVLSFNEGDQLGKFYFGHNSANIYFPQGIEEFAIVSAEAQGEMPLNFKAKENGQYTISVNPENVEMNYLHLIDNITGADIDLLAPEPVEGSASYTFTAKVTDYESRFRLVFSANGASTGSATNETFAYYADGEIIIMADVCDASIQVIDLMGRVVYRGDAINRVSTGGMVPGVYVLRLINGENVKTQKIVIE
jgi:hypothetical protein